MFTFVNGQLNLKHSDMPPSHLGFVLLDWAHCVLRKCQILWGIGQKHFPAPAFRGECQSLWLSKASVHVHTEYIPKEQTERKAWEETFWTSCRRFISLTTLSSHLPCSQACILVQNIPPKLSQSCKMHERTETSLQIALQVWFDAYWSHIHPTIFPVSYS